MSKASLEANKRGTPARTVLYSEAAKYAPRAIAVLVDIMEHGDNDNARMGAAKAILAKAIPDLKATDLNITKPEPVEIRIVSEETINNLQTFQSLV